MLEKTLDENEIKAAIAYYLQSQNLRATGEVRVIISMGYQSNDPRESSSPSVSAKVPVETSFRAGRVFDADDFPPCVAD